MINQTSFIAVILLAVLVGALMPVLYQLYKALKGARALIDTMSPRLEKTLDDVDEALNQVTRIVAMLEGQVQTMAPLLQTVFKVGHSISRSREWLRGATALGPALLAGLRALFTKAPAPSYGGAYAGRAPESEEEGDRGNGFSRTEPPLSRR